MCGQLRLLLNKHSKRKKKNAEWRFKMLKSIASPDQQGVDPAKQTDTERVADDCFNCLHPKIAGIGTREVTNFDSVRQVKMRECVRMCVRPYACKRERL